MVVCGIMSSFVVAQSPSIWLTKGLVPSGLKQVAIGGYPGVEVNFTSTYSTSFSGVVFADLYNLAGQVIAVSVDSFTVGQGQTVTCFIPFVNPPMGTNVVFLFGASMSSVPVSVSIEESVVF